MAVYKDKWNGYGGNKWRVACYYTDWQGKRVKHEKRGFETKKEAATYEREFLAKMTKDINMGFGSFIDIYMRDIKPQIKLSTYATKENIINTHIRPYFENRSLSSINSTDILQWQNELLCLRDDDGRGYKQTYLRTIQNQLNAIFNHAVKYYDLPKNPSIVNKKMGKTKAKEMLFWKKKNTLNLLKLLRTSLCHIMLSSFYIGLVSDAENCLRLQWKTLIWKREPCVSIRHFRLSKGKRLSHLLRRKRVIE